MIRKLVVCSTFLFSGFAHAGGFEDVSSIMAKYLSTVTCEDYRNEDSFQIFKVLTSGEEAEAYGVLWTGDKSCGGGSGAGSVYITPVVVTRWGRLVVANDGEFTIPAREYRAAGFKDGLLFVNVPKYEEDDPNCCPSGNETFFVKYDEFKQSFYAAK